MTGGVGGVRPDERALNETVLTLDRRFFLVFTEVSHFTCDLQLPALKS